MTRGLLGLSVFFFISNDYNARTFSFHQHIFSATAAVATVSVIFLQSQHIWVSNIIPLAQFWGAYYGLYFPSSFDHLPMNTAVGSPDSPRDSPLLDMWSKGYNLTDQTLLPTSLRAHMPPIHSLFEHVPCAWHCFSSCSHKAYNLMREKDHQQINR